MWKSSKLVSRLETARNHPSIERAASALVAKFEDRMTIVLGGTHMEPETWVARMRFQRRTSYALAMNENYNVKQENNTHTIP